MDLFRMYEFYAQSRKWRFNVVDIAHTEVGGFRVTLAQLTLLSLTFRVSLRKQSSTSSVATSMAS